MSKKELSKIEANLALIVGLTQAQVEVMESLSNQYDKLTEVSVDFGAAREVWKQSAIDTKEAVKLQMTGLAIFDKQDKVKSFLKRNKLSPMWERK